jgi:hypothetical protein
MFVIYYRQGGPKRFRWGQALGSFETHQAALECCEELRRQGYACVANKGDHGAPETWEAGDSVEKVVPLGNGWFRQD